MHTNNDTDSFESTLIDEVRKDVEPIFIQHEEAGRPLSDSHKLFLITAVYGTDIYK